MIDQQTRNNHYVPRWYQRGFLAHGKSHLFHLNLDPDRKTLLDGREVPLYDELQVRGTKNCFVEHDLYTTHFGPIVSDEVERRLFGVIDDKGAKAVRAFAVGNQTEVHETFQDFFEHLAAQKLRTPKGLDWIRSCYGTLTQVELMVEMQALRLMHCTMWAEGVREIVSAQDSDVKFILTDHPVTVYNAAVDPSASQCAYPQEPVVAALGTQTVFALDANTCIIFTHLEYAKQPDRQDLLQLRTNARHLDAGMTRTDNFIRNRTLTQDEVIAINYLFKSRAKRYIAAADKAWLYPDQQFKGTWSQIAKVLLPKSDLWRFSGKTYVGYENGSSDCWDEYGRKTLAHEYLKREPPRKNVGANDLCGCGRAYVYKDCCQPLRTAERPPWDVYSLRERNLMFIRAVESILRLDGGATWIDIRRNLSDEQVQRIHSAFAGLWPEDTDLASLLPRPNPKVLRSVYLGFADPRTVQATVLSWLLYFDEIVLVNPFLLGTRLKPEFSPIDSPSSHKTQTLKNVLLLLLLEPFIRAGFVHLVPDPADINSHFGKQVRDDLDRRTVGWTPPRGGLRRFLRLGRDEYRRFFQMLPEDAQRRIIAERLPGMDAAMTDQIIAHLKSEAEADPYALLQKLPAGKSGAQNQIFKGLSLESALYLASLTGSIIHVDTEAHWEQLLRDAQLPGEQPQLDWTPTCRALGEISFQVDLDMHRVLERVNKDHLIPIRSLLRRLAAEVASPTGRTDPHKFAKLLRQARGKVERAWDHPDDGRVLRANLDLHVPPAGFGRNEVQRLLVMYAGATRPQPIPFALRLIFDDSDSGDEDPDLDGESSFWPS